MPNAIETFLNLFGFTKYQYMIAAVCVVILLANFAGGLMSSVILANAGPQKERPFTDRIAFRMALMSEIALVIFAIYYHIALIQDVTSTHVVYWCFTLLAAPLLAFIGSQITYLVFSKKIEANKIAYRKWEFKQRQRRAQLRKEGDQQGQQRRQRR